MQVTPQPRWAETAGDVFNVLGLPFATKAHDLFPADRKPSRRQRRASIETGQTSPKQTGYVLSLRFGYRVVNNTNNLVGVD